MFELQRKTEKNKYYVQIHGRKRKGINASLDSKKEKQNGIKKKKKRKGGKVHHFSHQIKNDTIFYYIPL